MGIRQVMFAPLDLRASRAFLLPLPPGEGGGEGKSEKSLLCSRMHFAASPHPNPLPEGEGTGRRAAVQRTHHRSRFTSSCFTRQDTAISPPNEMTLRPAIFLDRDGVLNHTVVTDGVSHPPNSVAELQI